MKKEDFDEGKLQRHMEALQSGDDDVPSVSAVCECCEILLLRLRGGEKISEGDLGELLGLIGKASEDLNLRKKKIRKRLSSIGNRKKLNRAYGKNQL